MGKSLSNKYGQKLLDSAKTSTTDAIKTASKTAIQKTAEATLVIRLLIKQQVFQIKNLQKNYLIMMKQKKMQKQLLIKKDTYHQKKDSKLLMNYGQYLKNIDVKNSNCFAMHKKWNTKRFPTCQTMH